MSDKAFVDTNVLVYAHEPSTGTKHERARALVERLWIDRSGVVSTQVLQELCVTLQRNSNRPVESRVLHDIVTDYCAWEVHLNDGASILAALQVQQRFKISFWDALILAAAERSSASIVYSEDFSHGRRYGRVRVVNPFL